MVADQVAQPDQPARLGAGSNEGDGSPVSQSASQPGRLPGFPVDPGGTGSVAILAIQYPPEEAGGMVIPGRTAFAAGLAADEKREILLDIEWFDVRVRRREFAKLALTSDRAEVE